MACKDLVGNAVLPANTQSPDTYNTPTGALGMFRGVKEKLAIVPSFIVMSGALTDELTSANLGSGSESIGATGDVIDERMLEEGAKSSDGVYGSLQVLRNSAAEAIGLLGTYAPAASPALRGEMYALKGYAEILLADLYCSGVPLSTLDFQQDFTYKPSSTTDEVYQHAVALFDSALAISSDSVSTMWLASVAKGRALLNLGQYDLAAQAVATVPDTFTYQVPVPGGVGGIGSQVQYWNVATREGGTGVPFSATNDPRAVVTAKSPSSNPFGVPQFWPAKYPIGTTTPIVLASGVEARLIEAEAALQASPNDLRWLRILNQLRTSCVTTVGCATPAPAGTGRVAGLPLLSDPGSDTARVTLLFTERAYWLFLTGHRQGDLRRLVRNYGRLEETIYPSGAYFGGFGFYGDAVTVPIPASERINPLFHGCLNREA